MRCMPRATLRGLSTWITRSIAPMSMPSSRLLVATRAGRRPAFSSSSISVRCSRARLPWWARATSSSASSLSRSARRSASRRLLTKISVERWARTSSAARGTSPARSSAGGPRRPAPRRDRPLGRSAGPARACPPPARPRSRSSSFAVPASTISTGRGRPVAVLAAQEARDLGQRAAGWPTGRCAGARPVRLGHHAVEPLQAQRQVGAALGPGDGVDLVDDHRADAGEDVLPARGEQQVEALGGGDQDVGRACAASAAGRAGACRRCAPPRTPRAAPGPAARRPRRCRPAARAGCARRRSSGPSAATGRAAAAAAARQAVGHDAVQAPTGTRRASCRSRSAPGSGCARRPRSAASPAPGRRSAPRTRPRTTRAPAGGRARGRGRPPGPAPSCSPVDGTRVAGGHPRTGATCRASPRRRRR